jgi:ribonuclease Z
MTTDVIPLGTASALPTRERHLSSVAVDRKGRVLLFDCGEGTQYRLMHAGLNRARVDAVFVTHLHGDHVYGLMGLLATMGQLSRTDPVTVVGPAELEPMVREMPGMQRGWVPYEVEFVSVEEGFECATVYETDELTVTARPLDHRVFTAGYRLEEKPRPGRFHPERARALGVSDPRDFGRLQAGETIAAGGSTVRPEEVMGPEREGIAVAYVTDTRPCEGGRRLAEGADLLYHDATFAADHADRAVTTGHATAREAAEIARDAGARRLLLGHFSARYETPARHVREARDVFPATDAAEELTRYTLDPREKWEG